MKRCSKCGETKPLDDFYKASGSNHTHGVKGECKACWNARGKRYHRKNREKQLATGARWRLANRERHQAMREDWERRHPEFRREYEKRWRRENPEKARASDKRRDERHREKRRAQHRDWLERNREQQRQYGRRHVRENRAYYTAKENERRARKRNQFVEHVDPLVLMELDDGLCGICGEDVNPFDFHVDHIIPLVRGGQHSYANTQVSHPRCNARKGPRLAI